MTTVFRFPIKRSSNATEYYLSLEKYKEYCDSYPGIRDIDQEFRKMRQWCIDNPSRRKTEKGMPRFINSWLSTAQPKPLSSKYQSTRDRTLEQDLTDRSWAN